MPKPSPKAVLDGLAERGVLICGSGVGASVSANKVPGIRAGLCHDTYSARQGVEHDDVNVLVLGARIIGIELARELVRNFLAAKFTNEERHVRRLGKIFALEKRYSRTDQIMKAENTVFGDRETHRARRRITNANTIMFFRFAFSSFIIRFRLLDGERP